MRDAEGVIMGSWNDARDAMLRTRFTEGLTASQIARAIGGGLTRNAVIGRLHRLGLRRGQPTPRPRVVTFKPLPKPVAPKITEVLEPEACGPIHDFPPSGGCKWIHGVVPGPDWQCCGAPIAEVGKPYCAFHAARQYRKEVTPAAVIARHDHAKAISYAGKAMG